MVAVHQDQDTVRVGRLAADLRVTVQQMREQVSQVRDPRAKAMLGTSAEVANALLMALHHYLEQSEDAWE